MCSTELECAQLILHNTEAIKTFCYVLAVGLAIAVVVYVIQKVLIFTIGQVF